MFIGGKSMDIVNLNNINASIIPESNKIGKNYKKEIIMFSPSEFEGGRHSRRVDIINEYDENR